MTRLKSILEGWFFAWVFRKEFYIESRCFNGVIHSFVVASSLRCIRGGLLCDQDDRIEEPDQ
jgi:hypothetical protein